MEFAQNAGTSYLTVSGASSWSVSSNRDWCTFSTSGNRVTVRVQKNTGVKRTATLTFTYSSEVVRVRVYQAQGSVHYTYYKDITHLQQKTSEDCATTCVAMCLKLNSVDELKGTPLNYADWLGIANEYNCTLYPPECNQTNKPAYGDLRDVYQGLANGHPVCAFIGTNKDPHWVVVYEYSGPSNPPSFSAENFYCVDPYSGKSERLPNAKLYVGVSQYIIYIKN